MNKKLTEVVFIIDRSGSMCGLESDTIGGFNSILKKHKESENEAYVSTILFNHKSVVLHDRVRIQDVKPMVYEDYCACGCTALLDAVGSVIHHISNVHKYAREEDKPVKTLFVIITDGMENASHEYSYSKVKQMITEKQKEFGWEFLFLGANIDAAAEADRMGIARERAVRYENDHEGVEKNFVAVNYCMDCVCAAEDIPEEWDKDIKAYYNKKNHR